jgi:hypothetical protein
MYRKEFETDWANVNPNQLFIFNLDKNGEEDYYNNIEFLEFQPVVFYSISKQVHPQITFWDSLDSEKKYQITFRFDNDMVKAIEKYLDFYEEYEQEKRRENDTN